MTVRNEEKPVSATVIEQIREILDSYSKDVNEMQFGEIKVEIKSGKVYRIFVSNSVLIKGK